jgi:GTP pyrophosphokinase
VHGSHTRKGNGVPYIGHLMGVASIVIDDGGTEDEAIAALLHDAPEDRGGRPRLEDIRARFGDAVAKIVEDCTDSWTTPKEPWTERKQQYIAHARTLAPSSLGGRQGTTATRSCGTFGTSATRCGSNSTRG